MVREVPHLMVPNVELSCTRNDFRNSVGFTQQISYYEGVLPGSTRSRVKEEVGERLRAGVGCPNTRCPDTPITR